MAIEVGLIFPVFSQQLKGCYIEPEGPVPHFATPGWYIVEAIEGITITIRKKDVTTPFVVHIDQILAVVEPNFEAAQIHWTEKGLP